MDEQFFVVMETNENKKIPIGIFEDRFELIKKVKNEIRSQALTLSSGSVLFDAMSKNLGGAESKAQQLIEMADILSAIINLVERRNKQVKENMARYKEAKQTDKHRKALGI